MQQGNVLRVRTTSTVNFTAALAQGDALVESLEVGTLPAAGGGWGLAAGLHMRSRLHELRILSAQNLAWAVELWCSATGLAGADIDLCRFLGRWEFQVADGRRDNGETFWKYWVPGLDLSYEDLDMTGKLHVRLINLSATGKDADAAGAIVLEFGMEPTQGI